MNLSIEIIITPEFLGVIRNFILITIPHSSAAIGCAVVTFDC